MSSQLNDDEQTQQGGRFFRREGGYDFPANRTENSVVRRFMGLEKKLEPMVCEFSDDPAMQLQYRLMGAHMHNPLWGEGSIDPVAEPLPEGEELLVARSGKLCLAAMRLRMVYPDAPRALSFERDGFSLKEKLKDASLESKAYAEFVEFAALPDFKNDAIQREMLRRLFMRAATLGADIAFAACPLVQARALARIGDMLGLSCAVRTKVELPQPLVHDEAPNYLVEFDLAPVRAIAQSRKTQQVKNLESLN